MPLAAEAQLDTVMDHALLVQAVGDAGLGEAVDRALLQHAGAHAPLDVLAGAGLEHDGRDAAQLEQPREHQPGRARAHDPDLRLHHVPSSSVRAREAGSPGASSRTQMPANTISATVQPPNASCTAPSSHGPAAATM